MPITSACFLVGAAAICGLPPFNGFASEFLIYLGLFSGSTSGWLWSVAGLTALVLTGGLALACFAKACGIVFLGEARTPQARLAKEAGKPERLAMIFLAVLCLAIGLGLPLLAPLLNTAAQISAPGMALPNLSERIHPIAITCGSAAIILLGIILWRWQSVRLRSRKDVGTWDCGYAAPDARMQYTATSFAAPLTGQLGGVVQSDQHVPHLKVTDERPAEPVGLLPQEASFHDHPRDMVLDRLLTPIGNIVAWCCLRVRIMHHGHMPIYLLYIVVTMILLFLWSIR
jgi:NADH:ubiquinone oxidoreductase subunit 5 (subunit L)/multisubunit Na+/H+ antiporter MnhA subunit